MSRTLLLVAMWFVERYIAEPKVHAFFQYDCVRRDPVRFEEIRSKFLNYLKAKRCASYDLVRLGCCRLAWFDVPLLPRDR